MVLKLIKNVFIFFIFILNNGCIEDSKEILNCVNVELTLTHQGDAKNINKHEKIIIKVENNTNKKLFVENFRPFNFKLLKKKGFKFQDITFSNQHPFMEFWFAELDSTNENSIYEKRKHLLSAKATPPDTLLNLISRIEFSEDDNFDYNGLKNLIVNVYKNRLYLDEGEIYMDSLKLNISNFPAGEYRIAPAPRIAKKKFDETIKIFEKYEITIPKENNGYTRWDGKICSIPLELIIK